MYDMNIVSFYKKWIFQLFQSENFFQTISFHMNYPVLRNFATIGDQVVQIHGY